MGSVDFPAMILHFISVLALTVPSILSERRLEINVIPKNYEVDIRIDTESEPNTIKGEVSIEIKCKDNEVVTEFSLHSKEEYGINIRNVKVEDTITKQTLALERQVEDGLLTVTLSEALRQSRIYKLSIHFNGEITEENGYAIWKKDAAFIIATNAKRQSAFPCFDEPNLRTKFTVHIEVIPEGKIFSNQVFKEMEMVLDSDLRKTFVLNNPFPPSQISFVVTNIKLKAYINPFSRKWLVAFLSGERFSDNSTPDIKKLTDKMATKYNTFGSLGDLPFVQFFVIPTDEKINSFNWGLANISEGELRNPRENRRMIGFYTRITGMIFGGKISPDSWDSEWLFSALAEYMAYMQTPKQIYVNEVPVLMYRHPKGDMYDYLVKGVDQIQEENVSKHKGLMLLRMVHMYVEEKKFMTAINKFIKNHEYSSAAPEQLWKLFPTKMNRRVFPKDSWSTILKDWMEQKNYPVMSVEELGGGQYKVKQEIFISSYKEKTIQESDGTQSNKNLKCLLFPVSYTFVNTRRTKGTTKYLDKWLDCNSNKEITFKIKLDQSEVPIFNFNYAGLYRVKYDDNSWKRIVRTLETKKEVVDRRVRMQIIHDVFALAWAGYQDYGKVFSLQSYLEEEDDETFWKIFHDAAYDLSQILQTSPETYVLFQQFANKIKCLMVDKNYKRVFDRLYENAYYPMFYKDSLNIYWACTVGRNEQCREHAIKTFNQWMRRKYLRLKTQGNLTEYKYLFTTLLCTVLSEQETYDEEWNEKASFFLGYLYNDLDGLYRKSYIGALACIAEETVIQGVLEWTSSQKEDSTPKNEKRDSLISLAEGQKTFLPTLQYFKDHLKDAILPYHDNDYNFVAELVTLLTPRMNEDQIVEMETFIGSLQNEVVQQAFDKGKDKAALRKKWLDANAENIRNILAEKFKEPYVCVA